ncbi:MAG: hypothetical protein SOW84_04225 [Candidatus Faecousia sp.]|nr:hypothetical protein [Candidatus Faecousia sp.]
MYNRYIPQPDGTYQRNRMQDPQRPPQQPPKQPPRPAAPRPETQVPPPYTESGKGEPNPHRRSRPPATSAGSFLRQLLPGDFDTEDLLVVILLLLMAGDCQEDRNYALLTMALYLFL